MKTSMLKMAMPLVAAICATSAAMAAVNNLESYLFRFDFSKGTNEFLPSQNYADFDFVNTQTAPTNGPNGASNAATTTATSWKAFSSATILSNSWTIATSLSPAAENNAVVFSVGRLNKSGSRAVAICTSSDKSKLLVRLMYRDGSSYTCTEKEMTGLGDITQGFHTLVVVYTSAAQNHGTLTFYWDGVSKLSHTYSQDTKWFGIPSSPGGIQFNTLVSRGSDTSTGSKTFVYKNSIHSFYDFRFYSGAFNDSDVRAYAAFYPADRMGSPFRPSAYVESGATNAVSNGKNFVTQMNYIDTGYTAKKGTEFVLDFQYLDWATVQQYAFGVWNGNASSTPTVDGLTHAFYINDNKGFSFTRFSGTSADWHAITSSSAADRIRRIVTVDNTDDSDTGSTATILTWEDRSTMATATTTKDHAADAIRSTYLFAINSNGEAKRFTKARIYSFEADEDGAPVLFLAPDMQNGEAGFRNIIDGSFHGDGNKNNSPERTLRFYDGVGRASDYNYENDTLYAKMYVSVNDSLQGMVSVDSGAAAASAEGWVPHGGTLALSAVPASESYEFDSWTGDTWAIADGYSVSNASIEVSTPYAVQLRATFKPAVNAQLTIAADGASAVSWSTADWRDIDDSSVAIAAPVDKEVTVVAHKSVTLTLDTSVSLSKFIVQADDNCVVTLAASVGSFCANEVVVSNGVLKLGTDGVLGATPLVTVKDGATFDFNGKVVGDGEAVPGNVVTEFHIAGAGAGDWPWALTSSANMANDKNVGMIYLDANATVGGAKEMWMGVRDGAGWDSNNKNLNLNGFTLTKTGAGTLQVRRPYSGNEGTIDVQSGSVRVSGWSNATAEYGQSCVSNIALVVREGATAANAISYALYFKTLDLCGVALSGAFGMNAGETLAGHGTAAKLTMADGAVATLDGNLSVTKSLTADGALSLARKTGVETNVTVFVPGTFATVSGNTVTVGEGVILDLGVSRPAATLAADAAATLVLRLTAYDEAPVLNVSANPAQLIVYKLDGVTDITSGCTIEYDAEAGTITITPPVPVWTNADGTGSFESAANWDSGGVPADGSSICVSNATDVVIAVSSAHDYEYVSVKGGATLSFNGSGSLTVGALAFYDGTELKTGGVVVPAAFNGTGDLVVESGNGAGYSITGASTLTGKLTIKATASFTNTLSAAVNVTNMTVDAGENVVVTVVKGDGGSFYADEIVVAGGVLQQGSATVFGSTPKVTVEDGGTFDLGGFTPSRSTLFDLSGDGAGEWPWALTASGDQNKDKTVDKLSLSADATIGGTNAIWLGIRDGATFDVNAETKPLWFNGHALVKTGSGTLYIRRPYSENEGVLDIKDGGLRIDSWTYKTDDWGRTCVSNISLKVAAVTVTNNAAVAMYFKSIETAGATFTGAKVFGIGETLAGYGTMSGLTMGSGAVFKPTGTGYLNITSSLSGTLKLDLNDLDLSSRTKIPLVKVPTTLAETALSAIDWSAAPKGWTLKSKEVNGSVEYCLSRPPLTIILR